MENNNSENLRVGFHSIEMLLKLSPENIKSIRPSNGLHTKHYEEVIGKIKSKEFKDNLPSKGESITSLVTSIDRKNRQVNLSIFALEKSQEKELIKENISKNKQIESETKTSIGDLIQEELSDSSKD